MPVQNWTRTYDHTCVFGKCLKTATHYPMVNLYLCDGHWFQYKTMKASGRKAEFLSKSEQSPESNKK